MVRHTLRTRRAEGSGEPHGPRLRAWSSTRPPRSLVARRRRAGLRRRQGDWRRGRTGCTRPGRRSGSTTSSRSGVGESPELGQTLTLRVTRLARRAHARTTSTVELLHGPGRTPTDRLVSPAQRSRCPSPSTQPDGTFRYDGDVPLERTGSFGYTVRVLPAHPLLANSAEMNLVAFPPVPARSAADEPSPALASGWLAPRAARSCAGPGSPSGRARASRRARRDARPRCRGARSVADRPGRPGQGELDGVAHRRAAAAGTRRRPLARRAPYGG